MPLEEELAQFSPEKDTLITIGVFDGVHLGHKYLISQLTMEARQQNLLSGVITFRQHPQEVLSPQTKMPFLTDLPTRIEVIKSEGVDAVFVLSFTRQVAQLSARQFINLLQKYLRMRGMLIGPDFTLGKGKEGGIAALHTLGKEMGFSVVVAAPVIVGGEVVSSTIIRQALAEGNMKKVTDLIGRPFSLQGQVITGTGRGAKLGFPTANLDVDSKQALPADGVYATWAYIGDKSHQSLTNIGKNPTFGASKRTVEVYVPGYNGNLYSRVLKIDIVERLREEKKFDNAAELKQQMAEDVKQGSAILTAQGRN